MPITAKSLREQALQLPPDERLALVDQLLAGEEAAVEGGYVWQYLPDFSRRWGELEASPTMIWVQPPGTATVGHLYLDAYHATGDEQFYQAAKSATDALVRGQHPAGGWNYVIDTAGEESLKRWYETVGKNAWRLEEFQDRGSGRGGADALSLPMLTAKYRHLTNLPSCQEALARTFQLPSSKRS